MPSEIRQISFTENEAFRALVDYHRRRQLKFPSGTLKKIDFVIDPEVSATVLMLDDEGKQTAFKAAADILAASLILYCINAKIPIPIEAEKRLQKVNDNIALFIVKRQK